MTCSDVERLLPEFLDDAPGSAVPPDFDRHLKSCPACSDLVSDLKLIVSEVRQLQATEEPPTRVWVRIAAELRAEGLIREPESASSRPILPSSSVRRQPRWWWLTPVAAALLAAGSYVVRHRPAPQVATQQTPATTVTSPVAGATSTLAPTPTLTPGPQQTAQNSTKSTDTVATTAPGARTPAGSAPSAEDQQFLSVVSTLAPSMRTNYENQLQAVNADIRESQAYLDRNPEDADARQHLMDAYEQKALLYQIALDRIQ